MKKVYLSPAIRIQAIDAEDIMEVSLPVIDTGKEEDIISESSEILSNGSTVWDE